MKDPCFKFPVMGYNSWLFHFSVTFRFSGFRIMDLTGSLYFFNLCNIVIGGSDTSSDYV